jgi:hypothetical protein
MATAGSVPLSADPVNGDIARDVSGFCRRRRFAQRPLEAWWRPVGRDPASGLFD